MQTFKSFLNEATNTNVADVNEILLGYYLAGSNWKGYEDSSSVKSQFEKKLAKINSKQHQEQEDRAKRMAEAVIAWSKKNGYNGRIAKVYWTARPGALQKAVGRGKPVDSGNPTDILVKFSDGEFLGLSAKSTLKNSDIGFKNPGMGTVERNLGIQLASFKKEAEDNFIETYDLPKSQKERKAAIRADSELSKKANEIGSGVMQTMRDTLLSTLKTMSDEDAKNYLLKDWMDASDVVYPPYIKVTGMRDRVSVENPLENDKYANLNVGDIEFTSIGNESIGVTANGKKIMKIRFKFESQKLASSMKLSGDPW